jgi:hypothetical protein
MVEQRTFNPSVLGSSPRRATRSFSQVNTTTAGMPAKQQRELQRPSFVVLMPVV